MMGHRNGVHKYEANASSGHHGSISLWLLGFEPGGREFDKTRERFGRRRRAAGPRIALRRFESISPG